MTFSWGVLNGEPNVISANSLQIMCNHSCFQGAVAAVGDATKIAMALSITLVTLQSRPGCNDMQFPDQGIACIMIACMTTTHVHGMHMEHGTWNTHGNAHVVHPSISTHLGSIGLELETARVPLDDTPNTTT
jgi:hypothetical protein